MPDTYPCQRRPRGPSCCRSTSSASTSSPWSGRYATASTRACRRSTAACASAGWRSPGARSPTCSTAEPALRRAEPDRGDELVATSLADDDRLRAALAGQGRAILALDGLQPDVGHEVLWVVRECLSGEVLLARSLLSSTGEDLAALLREVTAAIGVPIAGVVSDGQHSVRRAVRLALPGAPHQLCQFHYLREAAQPIFEADRHAKKEPKKRVRGVRPIERAVEGRDDPEAEAVRGYCAAVRSAITDDGRPPLAGAGVRLEGRLEAVVASLDRVAEKGG